METALIGGLIRFIQGLAMASPTLLVGLLVAGVLRYYVGAAGTRRLFGGETLRSLPQSWLIGMLLPVCSIGVLPILREMWRARVRPGAMTAFALSAPLFNPLSLLYGLTLSRPVVIGAFALLSLAVVTLLGWIWDRCAGAAAEGTIGDGPDTAPGELKGPESEVMGTRRVLAVGVHAGRELAGPSGLLLLIALGGLWLLGSLLPHGALQSSVEQRDPLAPVRMALVAVPVYATPMLAMSQLGMMFQHANSPGAALVLLLLGTGMNLATLAWLARTYGLRPASVWFASLMAIVLACAYAVDRPLIPKGIEPAGHTHAFDIYTNPLHVGHGASWFGFKEALAKQVGPTEWIGLAVVGVVAVLGLMLRAAKFDDRSLAQPAAATAGGGHSRWDRPVPAPVLGGVLLMGLVASSVVGCFAYYPAAEEALEEIRIARAETLSGARSGDVEHALHWLPVWEEWSRRLEVGVFLRQGTVRPYQRMQGYIIRKKLELLEHELEHTPPEPEEIRKVLQSLDASGRRWREAFRD